MKHVLSLATFVMVALCFAVFLATMKANCSQCNRGTEQARAPQNGRPLVWWHAVANPNGWSVESVASDRRLLPSMTKSANEVNYECDVG